jgi:hypothetical protein
MKTFNEFKLFEASRITTRTFNNVNDLADTEADKFAAKMYADEAERMKSEISEIIDWAYCSSIGKEFKEFGKEGWSRKNTTGGYSYVASGSSQSVSGLYFTVKMKFPIKQEIRDFKVIIGNVPEYTFRVRLSFNTTGNGAYTYIVDNEGETIIKLSDTLEMGIIVDKLKKLNADQKTDLHKTFYHDWVETQDEHPLKGHVSGKKFGL